MTRSRSIRGSATKKELKPLSRQIDDFEIVRQILLTNTLHFNLSPTGSGKTYLALWIAIQFNLPIIVFTVKSTIGMWDEEAASHGVAFVNVPGSKRGGATTYSMASKKDVEAMWDVYGDIIKDGCLIIIDEFQNIKNTTANVTQSICGLVRRTIQTGGRSKIIAMSATPIDMVYQCIPMLYMTGFIDILHSADPDASFKISSIQNIEEDTNIAISNSVNVRTFLESIGNRKLYDYIARPDSFSTHKGANTFMFNFLRLYVIPKMGARMPAVRKIGIDQKVYNLFLKIHNDAYYDKMIEVSKNLKDGTTTKGTSGNFPQLLGAIELLKVPEVVALTIKLLTDNPTEKVIISINFKETLSALRMNLFMYKPLFISGDINDVKKRKAIIDLFQQDNNNYRLLIFTTATGSVGVSLDDIFGGRKRNMILLPGVSILNTIQALGRTYRAHTASSSKVYIIYGYSAKEDRVEATNMEMRIRNRLADKSENVETVLHHAISPNDMYAESIIRTLTSAEFMRRLDDDSIVPAPELSNQSPNVKEQFLKMFKEEMQYVDNYFY